MKQKEFLNGAKDGLPICLGYFSVSMAFGITAVLNGIPIWSAIMISLMNVTSAGQFAGINILTANGNMLELAVTTFIINIRYFLMSLSVSQKIHKKVTLRQRLGISFGITDEIFAVSIRQPKDLTSAYMAGLILIPVAGWTAGTAVGAVATSFMPQILSEAMGIALYAMFIAIVVPPARENKKIIPAVVLSLLLSVLFSRLPLLNKISGGWVIIIITVTVSALMALLFPIPDNKEEEE